MFKKNGLDAILADFTKTITKLEALVTANTNKVDSNAYVINQLKADNDALTTEAQKADAVKQKLLSLVS